MTVRKERIMGKKILKHLCSLVILVCGAVVVLLLFRLYQKEHAYKKGQQGIEALREQIQVFEETKEEEPDPETEEDRRFQGYEALHSENPDMAGWIRIDGTVIDYPVMHTPEDPEFYLYRDFQKAESAYGMIFIDGECRLDGTSPNLLIYGHHMRNGSMFAGIQDYDSRDFWQEHPLIQFDTLTESGCYQVIGAFKRPAGELDESFKKMLLAETEEDYNRLLSYIKQWNFYDTELQASWPEPLITLTTCEYTQKDGRFFVVAKKFV